MDGLFPTMGGATRWRRRSTRDARPMARRQLPLGLLSHALHTLLALLGLAAAGCGGSSAPPEPIALAGETMGTTYSIKLAALPAGLSSAEAQRRVDAELARVNGQMSTYDPNSELSRFNAAPAGDWFAVSPETAFVVDHAQRVRALSGGAFDVTVGPLVNLWGFGPKGRRATPPTDEEIAAARQNVGGDLLEVRLDPPALRKQRDGVYVDLSAIAKGHGVDRVTELIQSWGARGALVEIGGEVRAFGAKLDGAPWRVGVERPTPDALSTVEASAEGASAEESALQQIVALSDQALATSGDYRNFFEENGQRYAHIFDPRSGRPARHALTSASVLANNCLEADAWATTLMVLGPDEAHAFALKHNLAVLLVSRGEHGFTERLTPGFRRRLIDVPSPEIAAP